METLSVILNRLTLPTLGLLSSKAYICHVSIHWIALAEYFQMGTHLPGFQSFLSFLHRFVLTKLATSSIRVKRRNIYQLNSTIGFMNTSLTLMLVVAKLANTKLSKTPWKWPKPWKMGTHLRVLSKRYPMHTNMIRFRCLSKLCILVLLDESSLSIGRVKWTICATEDRWIQATSRLVTTS